MLRAYRVPLTSLVAVFALSGMVCEEDAAIERVLQPAVLEHYGDPVRVEIPDAVEVDRAFEILVWTYGGACVTKGETRLSTGSPTLVEPFDRFVVRSPPRTACTSELILNRHAVTLTFSEPGPERIVVRGVRESGSAREAIEVVRTVEVAP